MFFLRSVLLCWYTASIATAQKSDYGNRDNWGGDNNWENNNNWGNNNNNGESSTTPGPNVALIFMEYERAEIELMDLVEKEEEARGIQPSQMLTYELRPFR